MFGIFIFTRCVALLLEIQCAVYFLYYMTGNLKSICGLRFIARSKILRCLRVLFSLKSQILGCFGQLIIINLFKLHEWNLCIFAYCLDAANPLECVMNLISPSLELLQCSSDVYVLKTNTTSISSGVTSIPLDLSSSTSSQVIHSCNLVCGWELLLVLLGIWVRCWLLIIILQNKFSHQYIRLGLTCTGHVFWGLGWLVIFTLLIARLVFVDFDLRDQQSVSLHAFILPPIGVLCGLFCIGFVLKNRFAIRIYFLYTRAMSTFENTCMILIFIFCMLQVILSSLLWGHNFGSASASWLEEFSNIYICIFFLLSHGKSHIQIGRQLTQEDESYFEDSDDFESQFDTNIIHLSTIKDSDLTNTNEQHSCSNYNPNKSHNSTRTSASNSNINRRPHKDFVASVDVNTFSCTSSSTARVEISKQTYDTGETSNNLNAKFALGILHAKPTDKSRHSSTYLQGLVGGWVWNKTPTFLEFATRVFKHQEDRDYITRAWLEGAYINSILCREQSIASTSIDLTPLHSTSHQNIHSPTSSEITWHTLEMTDLTLYPDVLEEGSKDEHDDLTTSEGTISYLSSNDLQRIILETTQDKLSHILQGTKDIPFPGANTMNKPKSSYSNRFISTKSPLRYKNIYKRYIAFVLQSREFSEAPLFALSNHTNISCSILDIYLVCLLITEGIIQSPSLYTDMPENQRHGSHKSPTLYGSSTTLNFNKDRGFEGKEQSLLSANMHGEPSTNNAEISSGKSTAKDKYHKHRGSLFIINHKNYGNDDTDDEDDDDDDGNVGVGLDCDKNSRDTKNSMGGSDSMCGSDSRDDTNTRVSRGDANTRISRGDNNTRISRGDNNTRISRGDTNTQISRSLQKLLVPDTYTYSKHSDEKSHFADCDLNMNLSKQGDDDCSQGGVLYTEAMIFREMIHEELKQITIDVKMYESPSLDDATTSDSKHSKQKNPTFDSQNNHLQQEKHPTTALRKTSGPPPWLLASIQGLSKKIAEVLIGTMYDDLLLFSQRECLQSNFWSLVMLTLLPDTTGGQDKDTSLFLAQKAVQLQIEQTFLTTPLKSLSIQTWPLVQIASELMFWTECLNTSRFSFTKNTPFYDTPDLDISKNKTNAYTYTTSKRHKKILRLPCVTRLHPQHTVKLPSRFTTIMSYFEGGMLLRKINVSTLGTIPTPTTLWLLAYYLLHKKALRKFIVPYSGTQGGIALERLVIVLINLYLPEECLHPRHSHAYKNTTTSTTSSRNVAMGKKISTSADLFTLKEPQDRQRDMIYDKKQLVLRALMQLLLISYCITKEFKKEHQSLDAKNINRSFQSSTQYSSSSSLHNNTSPIKIPTLNSASPLDPLTASTKIPTKNPLLSDAESKKKDISCTTNRASGNDTQEMDLLTTKQQNTLFNLLCCNLIDPNLLEVISRLFFRIGLTAFSSQGRHQDSNAKLHHQKNYWSWDQLHADWARPFSPFINTHVFQNSFTPHSPPNSRDTTLSASISGLVTSTQRVEENADAKKTLRLCIFSMQLLIHHNNTTKLWNPTLMLRYAQIDHFWNLESTRSLISSLFSKTKDIPIEWHELFNLSSLKLLLKDLLRFSDKYQLTKTKRARNLNQIVIELKTLIHVTEIKQTSEILTFESGVAQKVHPKYKSINSTHRKTFAWKTRAVNILLRYILALFRLPIY